MEVIEVAGTVEVMEVIEVSSVDIKTGCPPIL